jgi:hypothetical protein
MLSSPRTSAIALAVALLVVTPERSEGRLYFVSTAKIRLIAAHPCAHLLTRLINFNQKQRASPATRRAFFMHRIALQCKRKSKAKASAC